MRILIAFLIIITGIVIITFSILYVTHLNKQIQRSNMYADEKKYFQKFEILFFIFMLNIFVYFYHDILDEDPLFPNIDSFVSDILVFIILFTIISLCISIKNKFLKRKYFDPYYSKEDNDNFINGLSFNQALKLIEIENRSDIVTEFCFSSSHGETGFFTYNSHLFYYELFSNKTVRTVLYIERGNRALPNDFYYSYLIRDGYPIDPVLWKSHKTM